jgi:molecular chaperone HtpG
MEKEVRKFDAEVGKILHLMIHSLYTNKDIFLRELISNASDACDKLRYLSVMDESLVKDDSDYKIKIYFDKNFRTLTIEDNGIGMNKEDLINNLGTIASSGTQKFMEQLTGDTQKDNQLIGQFGVGFYSAYMVAREIEVVSCKAGEKEKWKWTSEGNNDFSLEKTSDPKLNRGTKVILKLKEGEDDYLDQYRIRHIIKTYSDHISIPILLIDEQHKEEVLNSSSALWMRPKSEITADQYKEFYRNVAYSIDEPWMIIHNKNEGSVEYTNLLFVPTKKPFDLFHPDRMTRVKLYIRRVFITDDAVTVIPAFLRFLRGVIDSSDLPLNISRETLQHNKVMEKISKSVTNRVLSELKKRKENDFEAYKEFWNNYGPVLKEGLCEPIENKEKILELCLFKSVIKDKMITFDEYIADMKPGQNEIYYVSGESSEQLRRSPQLEGFIQRGLDVLMFTDNVDDFWVNVERTYKEKEIKSVTRSNINLSDFDKTEDNKESTKNSSEDKESYDQLIDCFTITLEGKVKEVIISSKLTESPVCLAVPEGAMDLRMERFLIDQKQLASGALKILEINPQHPMIRYINQKLKVGDAINDQIKDLVNIIFDEACILDGEPVNNVSSFTKSVNDYIIRALANAD